VFFNRREVFCPVFLPIQKYWDLFLYQKKAGIADTKSSEPASWLQEVGSY